MAVTKQVYQAPGPFTWPQVRDLFLQAFQDAGLITGWYSSFTSSNRTCAVMELTYNASKQYGKTYYCIWFGDGGRLGVSISSGWNASTNVPTGTQYLDWVTTPAGGNATYNSWNGFLVLPLHTNGSLSTSSNFSIKRYTSGLDNRFSIFMLDCGGNSGSAFVVAHPQMNLYPFWDLDKGIVPGIVRVVPSVSNASGSITLQDELVIRRMLGYGPMVNGATTHDSTSQTVFANRAIQVARYTGFGFISNNAGANYTTNAGFVMPIGSSAANPAYTTDSSLICTSLTFSNFFSNLVPNDFGVYMHCKENNLAIEDRFTVSGSTSEWEIVTAANNSNANVGVSPTFLAKMVD